MSLNLISNLKYQFSSFQNLSEKDIVPDDPKYLKALRLVSETIQINPKSLKLASNRNKILFLRIFQALYLNNLMRTQKLQQYEKKLKKKNLKLKNHQNSRMETLSSIKKQLKKKKNEIIQLKKEEKNLIQMKFRILKDFIKTNGQKYKELHERMQKYQNYNKEKFKQLQEGVQKVSIQLKESQNFNQQKFKKLEEKVEKVQQLNIQHQKKLSLVNTTVSIIKENAINFSQVLEEEFKKANQRNREVMGQKIQQFVTGIFQKSSIINPEQNIRQDRNQQVMQEAENDQSFSSYQLHENSRINSQPSQIPPNQGRLITVESQVPQSLASLDDKWLENPMKN